MVQNQYVLQLLSGCLAKSLLPDLEANVGELEKVAASANTNLSSSVFQTLVQRFYVCMDLFDAIRSAEAGLPMSLFVQHLELGARMCAVSCDIRLYAQRMGI